MKFNLFRGQPAGRGLFLLLAASLLFFGFLWLLDFPKPMIDDLCYSGAAMNMAGGGDLSNPFLARYFPGLHFYFIYPPVHSYVLAGWFKLFGLSAAAATGFQTAMYLLMTVAVIAILMQNDAPRLLAWLVPLIAAGNFLDYGLRTEAMATALTWAGFALIECGARRGPTVFFALFLMFLAGATAPRGAIFDVALILLAGRRLWENSASDAGSRWKFIIPGVAAFGTVAFIFLLMIHFKLGEFLTAFRMHGQTVRFKKSDLSLPHKGFLVLAGVMAIAAWRHRSARLVQICLAILVAMSVAVITHTLGFGLGGWYAMLLILFLMALVAKRTPRSAGLVLQAAFCVLLVWRNVPTAIEVYGILSGHISRDHGNQYKMARTLTSSPEQQLLLDPFVARYTFDYRIPSGSIDFAFSAPFPNVGTVMADLMSVKKSQDTYLLNPRFRDYVERSTYLGPVPRERWSMLRWSFDKYPRKVYVVRAEECKALKSATEKPWP